MYCILCIHKYISILPNQECNNNVNNNYNNYDIFTGATTGLKQFNNIHYLRYFTIIIHVINVFIQYFYN